MDYQSHCETDTVNIARDIAKTLSGGDVLALYGDLGAGKSVFCRALIRALCDDNDLNVPSPTFSLLQTYETSDFEIYHFDLYRLEHADEVYELGWEEALEGNLVLIEWPERIEPLLPPEMKTIIFEDIGDNERALKVSF